MGASISKLFSGLIWGKKDIRILILGLVSQDDGLHISMLIKSTGQRRQDYTSVQAEDGRSRYYNTNHRLQC